MSDQTPHDTGKQRADRRPTRGRRRPWGLATALAVVFLLFLRSAGAQERAPDVQPKSPLVAGLDGLVGGFFDGFLDNVQRAAHLSFIARDWDAAQLLLGHLSPVDQVLRERSRRMMLVRRRLADGPFVPFLQLGLGQWRVDPDMPAIPHDVVLAAELGMGAEWRLSRRASIAAEGECTVINPARNDALWIRTSALWGSFLAARVTF